MTLIARLLCPLLLALPMFATAQPAAPVDPEAREEAEKLLLAMNLDDQLQAALTVTLDMQLREKPEMVRYRGVMEAFFAKHMSFEALRGPLADIYAQEFTAEEMRAATDFYRTPLGQKFLEKMPRLMELGGELGQRQVMENMGDLVAGIQAEDARLAAEAANTTAPADDSAE